MLRTNREFDTQKEALEFIRQRFQDLADGQNYTGRIVVKKKFFACTPTKFTVVRFSNRKNLLYMIYGYKYLVVDAAPCEAWL